MTAAPDDPAVRVTVAPGERGVILANGKVVAAETCFPLLTLIRRTAWPLLARGPIPIRLVCGTGSVRAV